LDIVHGKSLCYFSQNLSNAYEDEKLFYNFILFENKSYIEAKKFTISQQRVRNKGIELKKFSRRVPTSIELCGSCWSNRRVEGLGSRGRRQQPVLGRSLPLPPLRAVVRKTYR